MEPLICRIQKLLEYNTSGIFPKTFYKTLAKMICDEVENPETIEPINKAYTRSKEKPMPAKRTESLETKVARNIELLRLYYLPSNDDGLFTEMAPMEIIKNLSAKAGITIKNLTEWGLSFKKYFGEKRGKKVHGQKVWYYRVVIKNTDEK